MPSPTEITVQQLSRLIGTPDAPAVIDVCIDDDFNADPRLIPASKRHPHKDIAAVAPGDPSANRQANPRPAVGTIAELAKRLEDSRVIGRGDANAAGSKTPSLGDREAAVASR